MAEVEVHSRSLVVPNDKTLTSIDLSVFDVQQRYQPSPRRVLFYRKTDISLEDVIARLKGSLATVLVQFFPLAGRFHIGPENELSVDCNDAGVEFIVASTKEAIPDFGNSDNGCRSFPTLAPPAHRTESSLHPLVRIQVTQFSCGSFAIGCSMNHVLADEAAFWHFLTSWTELNRGDTLSVPPVHHRFRYGFDGPPILAPASETPPTATRRSAPDGNKDVPLAAVFNIPQATIRRLQAEATHDGKLSFSTFDSVMAFWWKHVTRARSLDPKQEVRFFLAVNCRKRLNPPLPSEYFGNFVVYTQAISSAGDIMSNDLAFAANLLNQAITVVDDSYIRSQLLRVAAGGMATIAEFVPGLDIVAASSVTFPIYQCDFGWGKPAGHHNDVQCDVDGALLCDPGALPGSMDITAYFYKQTIAALRADHTFREMLVD